MNPRLFFIQGKQRNFPINTIIGGVAASISTKSLLASKLGIAESEIIRFQIVGSDVQANIKSDYYLPDNVFYNNSDIKSFSDFDGKVKAIGLNSLRNTSLTGFLFPKCNSLSPSAISYNSALEDIDIPLLTSVTGDSVRGNSFCKSFKANSLETILNKTTLFDNYLSAELIQMRNLKYYGNPASGVSAGNSGFGNLKTMCIIEVNIALKTANSVSTNVSLLWVKNNRSAIVKFYNDDGTYNSTL